MFGPSLICIKFFTYFSTNLLLTRFNRIDTRFIQCEYFSLQLIDWRNEFSKWFTAEFKVVKFPSAGNVFSYYIDPETKHFMPWTDMVPTYEFDPDIPLQVCINVPSASGQVLLAFSK